ncbi:MAG: antibiotic resistance protein MarC [Desulfurobacterium sp.]|nr:MAG: antibiotic resistance protein MarC [Desulfurobacterium sp.]
MEFLKYLISILAIIDPIFAAVIVVGLVEDRQEVERVALRSSVTVFSASLVTFFAGDTFLRLLGINIFSIKIFGGLILLHMAFQMLQAYPPKTKHTQEEKEAAVEKEDISIIPIGIPILFGPAAFTTVLIFREETKTFLQELLLLGALTAVTFIVYFVLKNAVYLANRMGLTGINVTVRVLGLFIGALGSQFIVDGVKHLWTQG